MVKTKLNKSIADLGMLQNRIRELHSECRHFGYSFEEYLDKIQKRITGTSEYQKLPRWAQSEIQGYRSGQYDAFERYVLEGRWELDGKQYTNGPEKEEAFKGRWHEVKYVGLWYPGTTKQWR